MQLKEPSRKEVWKMFDRISSTYDTTNRVMTVGLDLYWRKKMASFLPKVSKMHILDCATGTADQIISLFEHSQNIEKIVGIDLAREMLQIGKEKLQKKPYGNRTELIHASALDLPFQESTFDCLTMSFGIRNVTDVPLCLNQMFSVLKPKGRVLILETSTPKMALLRGLHLGYIRYILPKLGAFISRQQDAYQYLNKTAETFPSGDAFCALLRNAGFREVQAHPLTLGCVTIYQGDKP